jgi:hypothetical protein
VLDDVLIDVLLEVLVVLVEVDELVLVVLDVEVVGVFPKAIPENFKPSKRIKLLLVVSKYISPVTGAVGLTPASVLNLPSNDRNCDVMFLCCRLRMMSRIQLFHPVLLRAICSCVSL